MISSVYGNSPPVNARQAGCPFAQQLSHRQFSFKNSRFCLYMASRRDYRRKSSRASLVSADLREPMLVRSRKSRIFTGLREFFIEKQAVRS